MTIKTYSNATAHTETKALRFFKKGKLKTIISFDYMKGNKRWENEGKSYSFKFMKSEEREYTAKTLILFKLKLNLITL